MMIKTPEKEKKDLVVFGYGLGIILTVISLFQIFKHDNLYVGLTLDAVAAFMVLITALNHPWLKIIYKYWMKGAHFIGEIITSIILILFFYLIFGLMGIILKILRKDLLNKKWDKTATTHWIKKEEALDPKHVLNQF